MKLKKGPKQSLHLLDSLELWTIIQQDLSTNMSLSFWLSPLFYILKFLLLLSPIPPATFPLPSAKPVIMCLQPCRLLLFLKVSKKPTAVWCLLTWRVEFSLRKQTKMISIFFVILALSLCVCMCCTSYIVTSTARRTSKVHGMVLHKTLLCRSLLSETCCYICARKHLLQLHLN